MSGESDEIFDNVWRLVIAHRKATGYPPTLITMTVTSKRTLARGLKLHQPVEIGVDKMTMFGIPVEIIDDGDLPYFVEGL